MNIGAGMPPICKAVISGDFDLADLFVKHGANINVINNDNDTPLTYWIKKGNQQVKLYYLTQIVISKTSECKTSY